MSAVALINSRAANYKHVQRGRNFLQHHFERNHCQNKRDNYVCSVLYFRIPRSSKMKI